MAFFAQTGPSASGQLSDRLGAAIGSGIGEGIAGQKQLKQQKKQSDILSRALFGDASQEELAGLDPELQIKLAQVKSQQSQVKQKYDIEQQKALKEQQESRILSKAQRGEELTPEESSQLSPTSLRGLIGSQKEVFEKESDKLEAKRVSELATNIERDFKAAQSEDQRLSRMEKLSEKGTLSTPTMVKALQSFNMPLSILTNPDTEEYSKLESDFLRDIRDVFPGGRITNYEIQSYLRTVPTLLNSKEGQAAVVRNRRLQNEAIKTRYDGYKDILKENGGKKPPNMGILLEEKIRSKLSDIETRYKEGIQTQIEKFQQPIRLLDPNGNPIDVPPGKIEAALKAGARFK